MDLPRIVLLPRRARPFYGGHPWVYAGAIARVVGEPSDGDAVDLFSHGGSFIARGLYNSRSKIRIRLYSWCPDTPLERPFFRDQLAAALHLRRDILGLEAPRRACRLVYSEGDGLSGLVVDRYDRWLVMQFTALGLAQRREILADLLMELLQPEGIYLRTERSIGRIEGLDLQDGLLRGTVPAQPVMIEEDGLRFLVHLTEGQKTGWYLDQRDNRRTVSLLARSRRVLDAFCYTGAFSIYAARAGASEVWGVDVSAAAVALAQENARLNGLPGSVSFVSGDVFERLDALNKARERFGLIILDPPKFARTRQAIDEALRGYRHLYTLALQLLEPDGILVSCCCSGLITADMLENLLAQLAVDTRRPIQLLERRGQAPDHPVLLTCPESAYLKCLVCRVR
jgi:23S rRNA (cytosine1962-C5)-methyltransferase